MTTAVHDWLRRRPLAQAVVRTYRRKYNRPRWTKVAGRPTAATSGSGAQRVLVATSVGGHLTGLTLESALAAALGLRGAQVEALLCDSALPACLECTVGRLGDAGEMSKRGPGRLLCPGCFAAGEATFKELGVPVHAYSNWLTDEDRTRAWTLANEAEFDDLSTMVLDQIRIGEHALAGALRFFARADLVGEPEAEQVLRRYVEAAFLTTFAITKLIAARRYDVVVFHHGIYVPQGLIGDVARACGVRVVNWNPAYRKNCFIFSHGDTYHHTLMEEDPATWEKLPWPPERERQLLSYLASRWHGAEDWIWFHHSPSESVDEIQQECGVDFSKPVIGLLTNVMWDAQLHYPANAFRDMREWLIETIEWFAQRPDMQLLIRVHPAEIRGTVPSRQLVADEIARAFPNLPNNVFVLPPESPASTYVAMAQCDSVLIYGTKTGVELTAMGIPVAVAGEAWIRGKGVTRDASDRDDYFAILSSLPAQRRLDEATVRRARKYAYHFFFRRMIPVDFVVPTGGDPVFKLALRDVEALAPGVDPGLDCICAGILGGDPFVFEPRLGVEQA